MLILSKQNRILGLVSAVLFLTACSDITTEQILQKYRENPRRGGIREDIITHDLLPEMKKDAKEDIIAINFAQNCFSKANNITEAERCRYIIVDKYGDEYSFRPFKKWDLSMQQKVLTFLTFNKESAECYLKANKARDILPCKDPKDPDF